MTPLAEPGPQPLPQLPPRRRIVILVVVWILVVAGAMLALVRYSLGPGRPADPPSVWPASSHVSHRPGRPSLVLIAHPKCVCTRASLGELALLLTHCPGRAAAAVIFVRPHGTSPEWNETDLRRSAEEIPGVTVLTDEGGREAALFGASTSGQVLLYDGAGRLQFSGGITDGRGHSGDNPGRTAVEHLLQGRPGPSTSPVFGCALFASNEARE